MAKNKIKFDGGSYSRSLVEGKSEDEFLEAMQDKTYAHLFEGDNREAKLKELYAAAQPKGEVVEETRAKTGKNLRGQPKK